MLPQLMTVQSRDWDNSEITKGKAAPTAVSEIHNLAHEGTDS